MKIFLTGATGYIGGTVALRLMAAGHEIVGLARTTEGGEKLKRLGIEPVLGSLADRDVLAAAARRTDGVINAANSDNRDIIEAVLPALRGSGKIFIQTSGSSIVGDKAAGERSDKIYDETVPVQPLPEKAPRVAINDTVVAAAGDGVRGVVLCPTLIYGTGRGIHRDSVQVPRLIELARKSGVGRHVGRGENIWSNVHIDDVAELFLLALEKAPAGAFYYAENGEASMKIRGRGDQPDARLRRRDRGLAARRGERRLGPRIRRVHLRLEQPGPGGGGAADPRLDPARPGSHRGDRARLVPGGIGVVRKAPRSAVQPGFNELPLNLRDGFRSRDCDHVRVQPGAAGAAGVHAASLTPAHAKSSLSKQRSGRNFSEVTRSPGNATAERIVWLPDHRQGGVRCAEA